MTDFIFNAPSVKFSEKDLTFVSKNVGVTTLGLVGETPKGPAFEPVPVSDILEFKKRFGDLSNEKINTKLKYQLPYVANSYLKESNQLYVTRVLGLSGYNAGTGWAIILEGGLDRTTTGVTTTTTGNTTYTSFTFSGQTVPSTTGTTSVVEPVFTKNTSTNVFTGVKTTYSLTTLDSLVGSGTTYYTNETITGSSLTTYENMVVAIIRSKGTYTDNELEFTVTGLTFTDIDSSDDVLGTFTLTAAGSFGTEDYTVSLNPSSREYVSKVIGNKPKTKNSKIYVEAIYPDLIKYLDDKEYSFGVGSSLVELSTSTFTDYAESYQTPETPWVVSELRGNKIERLFKFISISDGNAGNSEIKITIQNIDPATKEFDVIIRDFADTDDNIIVLESFQKCSMNPQLNSFVGKRIGTQDTSYELKSKYIMLELNADAEIDAFPCGFEGYMFRSFSASTTGESFDATTPIISYKKSYSDSDVITRTYLGISEKGYDGDNIRGTGINQNMFNYIGAVNSTSSYNKTKGFHLDSGATDTYTDGSSTIGTFEVGSGQLRTSSDVSTSTKTYYEKSSRKFTFVPYGGFDGWDEHQDSRTTGDIYKKGNLYYSTTSDYYAYLAGIQTFKNPDDVYVNLFATPGINWSDNLGLINETIFMIERQRADSLYVVDSPDLTATDSLATDVVSLLDSTNIDSNYSATYFPWISVADTTNNVDVYVSPTVEVVRAIAYTDNTKAPWWAPAGLDRGATFAKNVRKKFNEDDRGVLYNGRINPMVKFNDVGVTIWGQKTLQQKETALSSINVRRLMLRLKKLISNISIRLLFDQNDQEIRDQFLTKVEPLLDQIRVQRGVYEFKVQMDDTINTPESIDRKELYGKIFIKPTRSVEFIGIEFNLTPTGASFANI